jgi:putative transposon-encoded protein
MNEPMKITLDAYQFIKKVVKNRLNSGRIYFPREWIGKRVKMVLIYLIDEEK